MTTREPKIYDSVVLIVTQHERDDRLNIMQSTDSTEPISVGLEPLDSNGLNVIAVMMSVLLMSVGAETERKNGVSFRVSSRIELSVGRPVNPHRSLNEARHRLREQCALAAFLGRWPYGLESYFPVLGEEMGEARFPSGSVTHTNIQTYREFGPITTNNSYILYDDTIPGEHEMFIVTAEKYASHMLMRVQRMPLRNHGGGKVARTRAFGWLACAALYEVPFRDHVLFRPGQYPPFICSTTINAQKSIGRVPN
ncbi:hypothetical protein EAG_12388 [Camponotus floridanus]|uniref:Uncharacterized protein n=1 Tax=Camponotus floridanus TaxID=104421 RepID=E2AWC5_CAMFO|nr:hypothetical protein EAG_12388 [Camponotus floridanus]